MLKTLLIDKENQIRTSIKIIIVTIIAVSFYFIFYSLLISIGIKMNGIIGSIALLTSIFLTMLLFVKLIEKKTLASIDITYRKIDILYFLIGMITAFAINLVIMFIFFIFTDYQVSFNEFNITIIFQYLLLAISEEILFRGFLLNDTFHNLPFESRSLIVALIFALTHLGTGYGIFGSLIFPFVFAILANYFTKYTKSIWLSTAFHFMTNLCITVFFIHSNITHLIVYILPFIYFVLGIPIILFLKNRTQKKIQIQIH